MARTGVCGRAAPSWTQQVEALVGTPSKSASDTVHSQTHGLNEPAQLQLRISIQVAGERAEHTEQSENEPYKETDRKPWAERTGDPKRLLESTWGSRCQTQSRPVLPATVRKTGVQTLLKTKNTDKGKAFYFCISRQPAQRVICTGVTVTG